MPKPILTIAIPTYNRNEVFESTLATLIPQITKECILSISDNASPTPVRVGITPYLNRNILNIGAAANILRLIEQCDTEYIWILGDDDRIAPDAVDTVLRRIHFNPLCAYFQFNSPLYQRRITLRGRGLENFVNAMDSWTNTLFISASVYRTKLLQDNIITGYTYAYSRGPHIALLLAGMKPDTQWLLSNHCIIAENGLAPDRWSCIGTALGFPILLELVENPKTRQALASKILPHKSSQRYIVQQLALMALQKTEEALFLYDTIDSRLQHYSMPPIYRTLVRYPKLGLFLMSIYHRISKGKPMKRNLIPWERK